MECLVLMENVYNVDACKIPALFCYTANKLFGQQWLFEKGEESNTDDIEKDHHSEELSPEEKTKRHWASRCCFTNKEVNKKNGC